MGYSAITCARALLLFTFAVSSDIYADDTPDWFGNSLGKDEIVLPGFTGITRTGYEIKLGGGRTYRWGNSFFPVEISAASSAMSGPLELVTKVNGRKVVLQPSTVSILEESPHHVIIQAVGEAIPGLVISSIVRIEYDGLAMVTLTLEPESKVFLDGLEFRVSLNRSESLRMMAFDADTIRRFNKEVVFKPDYSGKFLNAVGFADGNRSFWWFADNAAGWIWNADTVTEVKSGSNHVVLSQRLIGASWEVEESMQFRFNFIATPVKDLDGGWRAEQIAGYPTKDEAEHAKYHLWWTNVFAHETLPYTEYPPGVRHRLPKVDIAAYKGKEYNRDALERYRSWGLERLPYFSAHALTVLDPVLANFRDAWEVEPDFVIPPGSDLPYTAKIERPWLSQRAYGYADYLLSRFDVLIPELGLTGLYFDQASVIDSRNPAHGAWTDSRGRVQASTDILAIRDFYKRLATLFYLKGKPGYIFAHNSATPIVPAYTFVTSMLQGEEFVSKLKSLDYIDSISVDKVRTQFTTGQYGIRNTWLSELWSKRLRPRGVLPDEWLHSRLYIEKYRNLMALALLHDIQVLSLAPLEMRRPIYRILSEFGTSEADFHGYWDNNIKTGDDNLLVSFYKSVRDEQGLMVVANLGNAAYSGTLEGIGREFGVGGGQVLGFSILENKYASCRMASLNITVSPKNFCLVRVSVNSGE